MQYTIRENRASQCTIQENRATLQYTIRENRATLQCTIRENRGSLRQTNYPIMKYIILLSFNLLFLMTTSAQKAGPWELKKNKKEIKVYVRNNPASPIKELKMEFTVKASMSAIVRLLQDVAAIPDWVYKCPEAYHLEKVSHSEEVYYNRMDFPWPLDDRDLIVRNKLVQDPITKVVRSESFNEPTFIAEKEGLVRIPKLHLWWEFTPKENGVVAVEYFLSSDPGGLIPAWMINLAIDQGPTQTIKAFRKILQEPKYRDAQLDFISEIGQ